MPQAVGALLAYKITATLTVGALLGSIAISVGISLLSRVLFKPKIPDFDSKAIDRSHIIRSTISPQRVIYGEAQVSGVLVFAESSGEDNQYLHLIIVLTGHEVEAIDTVYFNEKPATDWDPKWYRIQKFLGTDDQQADPRLVRETQWSRQHRLQGIAYLYVRLTWDKGDADTEYTESAWPNGVPNIKADVRGKKVYDPRTDATAYSNNWALCVADYLRDERRGLGTSADEVDYDTVTAAANICDEDVVINQAGDTQKRYRCDGVFELDSAPLQILEALRTAAGGAVIWSGGQWQVHPAAPVAATRQLNEDDLRGDLSYQPRRARSELFNAVRGTFIDPTQQHQPTDFPPVVNPRYEAEDGGERIWFDTDLPFTNNAIAAQRLAKIELERHRQSVTVAMPCKLTVLGIKAWDVIELSITHLGWVNKKFQVLSWTLTDDLGIDLELVEYADEAYIWNLGDAVQRDPAPDTRLPDPRQVPAPLVLKLDSTELFVSGAGDVHSQIIASWTPAPFAFVASYHVQYKLSGAEAWTEATAVGTRHMIQPVLDGEQYDVRVRAVNTLGAYSRWTSALNHLVQGKTTPPANVSGFRVDREPSGARIFRWNSVSDLDLRGYLIQYKLGTGHSWDALRPMHEGLLQSSPWETNQLAAGVYTIGIVAVDTSGNESVAPAIIESNFGNPYLENVIYYHQPHLHGWPGDIVGGVRDQDASTITGVLPQDLRGDNAFYWLHYISWDQFETWGGRGRQNDFVSGDSYMSYFVRVNLGIEVSVVPYTSAEALGDVTIEIRYRDSSSPFFNDFKELNGVPIKVDRFLEFRITVTPNEQYPDIIKLLSATLALSTESKTELINDSDTGDWAGSAMSGRIVPTTVEFTHIYQIQLALQSVGPGWTWEVIDKDASAPKIKIYNAAKQPTDAVVDVLVRGVPTNVA